ncbi:MAG: helix-turn-helix domain-containing protein [Rhizobiaceae bacterium]|nr:helix-turn-helix domain-containing protein [Rhizobiaceae bacterium]|tara:strand:+ start:10818 stop:11501 length:684 start_codon:yes stop_codon:yes gene_type:complete
MYVTSPVSFFENSQAVCARFVNEGNAGHSHISHVPAGHRLFCDGDDADYIYEIMEGVVRTSKLLSDGRRQVLSFGYPGDIAGLSHDHFYHSDCEALSGVTLRLHHKNAFNVSFENEPDFNNELLKYAAAEVNNMQEHFIMLGRKSATEKVASFLITLMDRVGQKNDCNTCFELPMCRSDIADFLGLTIETISRTLTKLRAEGVIELPKKQQVLVCKPSALRALAERN